MAWPAFSSARRPALPIPLVGDPLLLQSFTAVVLGGTLLGGGSGSAVGSVIGAYTLMLMINLLLALDVSAYFSTIAEGVVLILAVVWRSRSVRTASRSSRCARGPLAAGALLGLPLRARSRPAFRADVLPERVAHSAPAQRASWLDRNRDQLRYVLPAYVAFVLVVIVTQFVYPENIILSVKYYNSLVVLGAFLGDPRARTGRGDPVGRARPFGAVDDRLLWDPCRRMIQGSNMATIWAVPLALGAGALIGLVNGLGVAARSACRQSSLRSR